MSVALPLLGVAALMLLGRRQKSATPAAALPAAPVVTVPITDGTITDIEEAAAQAAAQLERDAAAAAAALPATPAPAPKPKPKPKPPASSSTTTTPAREQYPLSPVVVEVDSPTIVPYHAASAPDAAAPKPQPTGYDPVLARRGAASLAAHLKRAGRSGYDRRLLETWQRQAGITPDRIYGGATRGALIYFGVANPPQPFFKPTNTIDYVPPEDR